MVITFDNLKNYIVNDPILDWLNLYGEKNSYKKDSTINYFNFLLKKSIEFKVESLKNLLSKIGIVYSFINKKTIIYKNNLNKDFYTNLFVVNNNFQTTIDMVLSEKIAKNLFNISNNLNKYYIVKFAYFTGKCNKYGILSNNHKHILLKYRIHFDYNLIKSKEYDISPNIIIIFKNIKNSNKNWIIYNISQDTALSYKNTLKKSIKWYKFISTKGDKINLNEKNIKILKLYPNMKNTNDYPWSNSKMIIAKKYKEITLIWNLNYNDRNNIIKNYNINTWDKLEINMINKSTKKKKIIEGIISINKSPISTINYIINNDDILPTFNKEIYIDYEVLTNIFMEDFNMKSNFVFMIGALFVDNIKSSFKFRYYLVEDISNKSEKKIFVNLIKDIINFSENKLIPVFHWGDIENYIYKNIKIKYNIQYNIKFIDLNRIFKNNNIYIKGCFNYSLKNIGNALFNNNIIQTKWDSNISNGIEAMLEYYYVYKKNYNENIIDIIRYNYVDVKILQEINSWLKTILIKKNI